jgi:hypothetical protein
MTVSELINVLQKLPLDYTIEVFDEVNEKVYPVIMFESEPTFSTAVIHVNPVVEVDDE